MKHYQVVLLHCLIEIHIVQLEKEQIINILLQHTEKGINFLILE